MTLFLLALSDSGINKKMRLTVRPAIRIIIITNRILLPKNLVDRLLESSGTVIQDTTVKIIINSFTATS
jgi:hypothetical protein